MKSSTLVKVVLTDLVALALLAILTQLYCQAQWYISNLIKVTFPSSYFDYIASLIMSAVVWNNLALYISVLIAVPFTWLTAKWIEGPHRTRKIIINAVIFGTVGVVGYFLLLFLGSPISIFRIEYLEYAGNAVGIAIIQILIAAFFVKRKDQP